MDQEPSLTADRLRTNAIKFKRLSKGL